MAEVSWPWDGTTLGDATTAPYSSSEYAQFVRTAIDDHGVAPNARLHIPVSAFGYGSLLVTGTATPVAIAAGYAYIAGFTYINDTGSTLAIATPGANPRKDRVILRISWAAQTIRLVLLAGVEAATPSPPALTQTIGTTYEVSLAQVNITTGGVVTVLDERPGFMGLGPGVFFRDVRDRVLEEYFENFSGVCTSNGWSSTAAGTGALAANTGVPSSNNLTTGANAASSLLIFRGTAANPYPNELAQAPILMEARMQIVSASDAQSRMVMRLIDAAGTSYIQFGMIGSVSTANLVLSNAAGGAATNFTTGQAVDLAAYHTYGIYVPASGGPAVCTYDGVPIGQVAAAIPASGTDMRGEIFTGNGTTATARAINVDWVRLTRGTA